jgi:hypothetical protein
MGLCILTLLERGGESMKSLCNAVAFFFLFLIFTDTGAQAIAVSDYYVAPMPLGDNTNSGTNPTSPFATIQQAIDAAQGSASDPVIIHIAAGTYQENIVMDDFESLEGGWNNSFNQRWDFMSNGVQPTADFETIIDGGGNGGTEDKNVIIISSLTSSSLSIDGLTIKNGYAYSTPGAGIYSYSSSPTIKNCTISNNSTAFSSSLYGGGMYFEFSSPQIINCNISDNGAWGNGGGIYITASSVSIINSKMAGNWGAWGAMGGAIFCSASSVVTINDSIINFNQVSDGTGGGIYADSSSLQVINTAISHSGGGWGYGGGFALISIASILELNKCTISGNHMDLGGGIYCYFSAPDIINCVISNNRALRGGGIYCVSSSPKIINSIITNNIAEGYEGGGIYCDDVSSPVIKNCILWGNSAYQNAGNQIYNASGSAIVQYSNVDQDGYGNPDGSADSSGNIRLNPLFVDPGNNDFHLQATSPCVDTGTDTGAPNDDKDGIPRPQSAGFDMGAYEYAPDSDGDGVPDFKDNCPADPNKFSAGECGCGTADTDSDSDGTPDCLDNCPADPNKFSAGECGCGTADIDSDSDSTPDCLDDCPADPNKIFAGECGCGTADIDSDNDSTPDCLDNCPADPNKTAAGACGCGTADTDSDSDGTPDCLDSCPADPNKTAAGACGCGIADTDSDNDSTPDCLDNCPNTINFDQKDSDGDGIGDACDQPDPAYLPLAVAAINDAVKLEKQAGDAMMSAAVSTLKVLLQNSQTKLSEAVSLINRAAQNGELKNISSSNIRTAKYLLDLAKITDITVINLFKKDSQAIRKVARESLKAAVLFKVTAKNIIS